jgi:hypothetical protein
LTTLAATVQATAGAVSEYGAVFGPWVQIPAASTGTAPRLVAPSSVVAGAITRQALTGVPNTAAAGDNGRLPYVLDVQTVFTNAELDALNGSAPVNVLRRPYPASSAPAVSIYGYNTLASTASGSSNSGWRQLTGQLLRLQITHDLLELAERFVDDPLDGKGKKLAEFNGAIRGVLQGYYDTDQLFGETPADAYQVDTASVNTPTTLALQQLNARVVVRISPYAEFITIDVVKFAVSQPLAA